MVANPYCCGAPAAVVALHWTTDHDERKNLLGLSFLHIIRPGSVFYIAVVAKSGGPIRPIKCYVIYIFRSQG